MTHAELADAIRAAAYLEGDFLLRSGKRSRYYLDKYLFETQPTILAALAERFCTFLTGETNCIAGAELGGVPLAAAVSLRSALPFVIVRNAKKDYGTSKPVEGRLPDGAVVLLVEDIATTGGQVLEAARTLVEQGARIERIVATIDREEGASQAIREAGFAFDRIFRVADLGINQSAR